jgi:Flagellar hook-length control protein FliK
MIASSPAFSLFELLAGLPSGGGSQTAPADGKSLVGAFGMGFGALLEDAADSKPAKPLPEQPDGDELSAPWPEVLVPPLDDPAPSFVAAPKTISTEAPLGTSVLIATPTPTPTPAAAPTPTPASAAPSIPTEAASLPAANETSPDLPSLAGSAPPVSPDFPQTLSTARSFADAAPEPKPGFTASTHPSQTDQPPTSDLATAPSGEAQATTLGSVTSDLIGPSHAEAALPTTATPLDLSVEVHDALRRVRVQDQNPAARIEPVKIIPRPIAASELGQRIAAQAPTKPAIPVAQPVSAALAPQADPLAMAAEARPPAAVQSVVLAQGAMLTSASATPDSGREAATNESPRDAAALVTATPDGSGPTAENSSSQQQQSAPPESEAAAVTSSSAPTLEVSTPVARPAPIATTDLHGTAQRAVADVIVRMAEDRLLASAAPKSATVELTPTHLGRVRIEVVQNPNQSVAVHLSASVKQTQLALAADADDIVEHLRRNSIDVQRVDVKSDADNADRGQRDSRGEAPKDRDSSPSSRDHRQHSSRRDGRQPSSRRGDLTDYRYWEAIR